MRDIPERLGLVAIPVSGEPVFVYCTIEGEQARRESWLEELVGYTEWREQPIQTLARVLAEQGVADGRIGVEKRHLSARDFAELERSMPKATFVAADEVFDRMRAIKTPAEIETLTEAAFSTDIAIRRAFAQATVGSTEREIADAIIAECAARGGGRVVFLTVATGPNGSLVHAEPGDARLEPAGVIRTDFGVGWGHYLSDIARTAFVGPITHQQETTYMKLVGAQEETIASVRPGEQAKHVYRACADAFARRGLAFDIPHVGHSIGVGLHERPMLQPFDETVLEPGMALMVEPGVMTTDGFYHTEDLIVITENGNRVCSRSADWATPMVLS
jgi:Xaa-Pro aminopeptidase